MGEVAMHTLLPQQLEVVVQTHYDPACCDHHHHHLSASMLVLGIRRIDVACCQGNGLPVTEQDRGDNCWLSSLKRGSGKARGRSGGRMG
jgi:hypothetical protein